MQSTKLLKHLLIAETKYNPLNICKASFCGHHTMAASSGPGENVRLIIILVLTKDVTVGVGLIILQGLSYQCSTPKILWPPQSSQSGHPPKAHSVHLGFSHIWGDQGAGRHHTSTSGSITTPS